MSFEEVEEQMMLDAAERRRLYGRMCDEGPQQDGSMAARRACFELALISEETVPIAEDHFFGDSCESIWNSSLKDHFFGDSSPDSARFLETMCCSVETPCDMPVEPPKKKAKKSKNDDENVLIIELD